MHVGRLYVSFWQLRLSNFPEGTVRRRAIDAATAKGLIDAARAGGNLRCGSADDLVAPYKERALRNHENLCTALQAQGISISIQDFLTADEEYHFTFPLELVRLEAGDQLLVVDCYFALERSETPSGTGIAHKIAPDSITFHLFEACDVAIEQDPASSHRLTRQDRDAAGIREQAAALGARLRNSYGQVTALVDRLSQLDLLRRLPVVE